MSFNIKSSAWDECFIAGKTTVDATIIFAWENQQPCNCFNIQDAPELKDFKGKTNQLALVYNQKGDGPERILIVGLGEPNKFELQTLRIASATGMRKLRELKLKSAGLVVDQLLCTISKGEITKFDEATLAQEAAISATHALYSYTRFHTKNKDLPAGIEDFVLIYKKPEKKSLTEKTTHFTKAINAGTHLTKDLCNGPANIITPAAMENAAIHVATQHGFKISVLREQEIIEKGMGSYAAVFKGSAHGGRLIILEWTPEDSKETKPIVFIGKGLTFDSGGISIKPSASMHEMKSDMAGAAAVLGMCEAIGRLGPSYTPRPIVALLACAENMPDGKSMRPGDIVTSLSGQTIEVQNTDAEGRLVLCDSLTYAEEEYTPLAIIDIATLTGACQMALGCEIAGMFCSSEKLQSYALEAGQLNGDRSWPLPLWDEYFENMKSLVADMSNAGSREGGAINAALFLKQFVSKDQVWMHLDIAGPAYNEKGNALREPGSTGFGLRIMLDIAMNWKK